MTILSHSLAIAIAVLAMLAAPAMAVEPPTDVEGVVVSAVEARVVEPVFAKHPAQFKAYGGPGPYFPDRAAREKVSGQAALQCILRANGVLEGCKLLSETPDDYGFGPASLKMAERRSMGAQPRLVDGQRLDGETVRLVVPFNAPPRGY